MGSYASCGDKFLFIQNLPVTFYSSPKLIPNLFDFFSFNRYKLAKDIDGQLKQMVQDLKSIIDHLNTANTQQQDSDDPV